MRADRRKPTPSRRKRRVPAASRVTVRRTVAALRRGRAALESLEQQLGDILAALAERSEPAIDRDAPDRLGETVRAAAAALASVGPVQDAPSRRASRGG